MCMYMCMCSCAQGGLGILPPMEGLKPLACALARKESLSLTSTLWSWLRFPTDESLSNMKGPRRKCTGKDHLMIARRRSRRYEDVS